MIPFISVKSNDKSVESIKPFIVNADCLSLCFQYLSGNDILAKAMIVNKYWLSTAKLKQCLSHINNSVKVAYHNIDSMINYLLAKDYTINKLSIILPDRMTESIIPNYLSKTGDKFSNDNIVGLFSNLKSLVLYGNNSVGAVHHNLVLLERLTVFYKLVKCINFVNIQEYSPLSQVLYSLECYSKRNTTTNINEIIIDNCPSFKLRMTHLADALVTPLIITNLLRLSMTHCNITESSFQDFISLVTSFSRLKFQYINFAGNLLNNHILHSCVLLSHVCPDLNYFNISNQANNHIYSEKFTKSLRDIMSGVRVIINNNDNDNATVHSRDNNTTNHTNNTFSSLTCSSVSL